MGCSDRVIKANMAAITRSKILSALNMPEEFILALVEINDNMTTIPRYVHRPVLKEPDFGAAIVNYDLGDLMERAETSS